MECSRKTSILLSGPAAPGLRRACRHDALWPCAAGDGVKAGSGAQVSGLLVDSGLKAFSLRSQAAGRQLAAAPVSVSQIGVQERVCALSFLH